jgi:hypothetical protein
VYPSAFNALSKSSCFIAVSMREILNHQTFFVKPIKTLLTAPKIGTIFIFIDGEVAQSAMKLDRGGDPGPDEGKPKPKSGQADKRSGETKARTSTLPNPAPSGGGRSYASNPSAGLAL